MSLSKRTGAILVTGLLAAALVADGVRPPARQWTARALLAGIDLYQAVGSRVLGGAGVRCRFLPSCSRYAEISIRRRGAFRGSLAALARLARCGPWSPPTTVDPPA